MGQNIQQQKESHSNAMDFFSCFIKVGDPSIAMNQAAWAEMHQMKDQIKSLQAQLEEHGERPTVQRLLDALRESSDLRLQV